MQSLTPSKAQLVTTGKIMVLALWLGLFALLLYRDVLIPPLDSPEAELLVTAAREEYQSIYFQDRKIGHVVNRFTPEANGGTALVQEAEMLLNVAGSYHQINLSLTARTKANALLDSFSLRLSSPFYQMTAQGKVDGRKISFTVVTAASTFEDSILIDQPPMLPTARRPYLLDPGLRPGSKRQVPWFDPLSLAARMSVVEYRGREAILINGRVHNLHHFLENFGGTRVNSWLNDEGDVMKEESPAGLVLIKEPQFKALAKTAAPTELLTALAVPVVGTMPSLAGLQTISYKLQLPAEGDFDLDGGRQRFVDSIVSLHLEQLPSGETIGNCPVQPEDLATSPYIQADAPVIVSLARQIVAASPNRRVQVERLAAWVAANIEKRPVLGLPDALTTLQTRRGDCNEHAALFAALARAAGIPTRLVAGLLYHRQAFYYHAWNEVCIGDAFVSIDTTTNQLPADLSHIRFIEGELAEQMRIGALLGQVSITPLPAQP